MVFIPIASSLPSASSIRASRAAPRIAVDTIESPEKGVSASTEANTPRASSSTQNHPPSSSPSSTSTHTSDDNELPPPLLAPTLTSVVADPSLLLSAPLDALLSMRALFDRVGIDQQRVEQYLDLPPPGHYVQNKEEENNATTPTPTVQRSSQPRPPPQPTSEAAQMATLDW